MSYPGVQVHIKSPTIWPLMGQNLRISKMHPCLPKGTFHEKMYIGSRKRLKYNVGVNLACYNKIYYKYTYSLQLNHRYILKAHNSSGFEIQYNWNCNKSTSCFDTSCFDTHEIPYPRSIEFPPFCLKTTIYTFRIQYFLHYYC